jgi:hypothetical protein
MLKHGDKGEAVKHLQDMLIELGLDLPRWGADGELGDETLGALALLLDQGGVKDDDRTTVSDNELAYVERLIAAHRQQTTPVDPGKFFDLRQQSNRAQDQGPRPWSEIDNITLHQTACFLAENPTRMLSVGAHFVTGTAGQVWWLHEENRIVWHGNNWNRHGVGIEMNGLYAGVANDPKTVWDNPATPQHEQGMIPTAALIEASCSLIRWIDGRIAAHGGKLKHIVSHRQASKDRRDDPGETLWKEVGLRMCAELGLDDYGPPGLAWPGKVGTGYPNPEQWDPTRKGVKY